MATKLYEHHEIQHQRENEDGNPTGTYFAIITLLVLLTLVGMYFWISHGTQVLESPVLQQGVHLTPHDAAL